MPKHRLNGRPPAGGALGSQPISSRAKPSCSRGTLAELSPNIEVSGISHHHGGNRQARAYQGPRRVSHAIRPGEIIEAMRRASRPNAYAQGALVYMEQTRAPPSSQRPGTRNRLDRPISLSLEPLAVRQGERTTVKPRPATRRRKMRQQGSAAEVSSTAAARHAPGVGDW